MKETEKMMFSAISTELTLPTLTESRDNRRGYVSYGDDNLFPQYIKGLYRHSALFESIVNGMKDYVLGEGVEGEFNEMNRDGDTLNDIIEKAIFDYILYRGFAIQVFKDKTGKIVELYPLDFDNCRISIDEDYVFYSTKWDTSNTKTVKYPMFKVGANDSNSIFYFRDKSRPQSASYPIPFYLGALKDIRTSVEISNFHLNSVLNDFNANLIVNFNSGDVDEDTKKRIEKSFKDKFSGTTNAGKFLLNFNDNKETAITIERLQSDDFDKRYESLQQQITKNIFVAFRAQPQLFGFVIEGSLFNQQEFDDAYRLYNRTVIHPIKNTIERAFRKLMGFDIKLKDFVL